LIEDRLDRTNKQIPSFGGVCTDDDVRACVMSLLVTYPHCPCSIAAIPSAFEYSNAVAIAASRDCARLARAAAIDWMLTTGTPTGFNSQVSL